MANSNKQKWNLTAYERQRKPQNIVNTDAESVVTSSSLHNELMCPICLGILKKTMTTKGCLHRFCGECIVTALRNGKKECPTCRKKLISKRSLRNDLNFDLLISKIYPNLDEYEAEHEKNIIKFNTKYLQNIINNKNDLLNKSEENIESVQKCVRTNQTCTKKFRRYFSISENLLNHRENNSCQSNSNITLDADVNTEIPKLSVLDEIEIVLKSYPISESTAKADLRYIKTTSSATVDHIKKYLNVRLNLNYDVNRLVKESNNYNNSYLINHIHLYVADASNHFITLNGPETLQQINDKFGKNNQPIEMYYLLSDVKNT